MSSEKYIKNKEKDKKQKNSESNEFKEINNSEYKNENLNVKNINSDQNVNVNNNSSNNSPVNNKFYNSSQDENRVNTNLEYYQDEHGNIYHNGVYQGNNGNINYNQEDHYYNGVSGDNVNDCYYKDEHGNVYHNGVYQGNNGNMNYNRGNHYYNGISGDNVNDGYYQDEHGNIYHNGVYQGNNNQEKHYYNEIPQDNENSEYCQYEHTDRNLNEVYQRNNNMNNNQGNYYYNGAFRDNANAEYYQDEHGNVYLNGVYQGNHYYNEVSRDSQKKKYDKEVQDNGYYEDDEEYNNSNYLEKDKKKKSRILIFILSFLISVGLIVLGYFGYTKFINKENIVDLSVYKINFVAYGTENEGKPSIDILEIPKVDSKENSEEIKKFLSEPDVSFDKQSNLKNGDKVTVTIKLNDHTANKYNLKVKGEFKKVFTVTGLSNKQEVVVIKEKESNAANKETNTEKDSKIENNDVATIIPEAGVNLRESASDNSKILKTIRKGVKINRKYTKKIDNGEYWSYVEYEGVTGWIRSDLIA